MTSSKIHNIELSPATRGWICEILFAVPTRRQFSCERATVTGYGIVGLHGIAGILSALWNAWRQASREYTRLQSLPGEFELS
jgi:hypothetical protein